MIVLWSKDLCVYERLPQAWTNKPIKMTELPNPQCELGNMNGKRF